MRPRPANVRCRPALPVARLRKSDARGAVLIVALLLAALIAVALGSYLNLNLSSVRLAQRTFNGYAALNLAEAGAEEAVWSFNRATAGDSVAWMNWLGNGTSAWRKFGDFPLAGNTDAWVKVYVDNSHPSANARPKIVTQSSVGSPGSAPVVKMLEVTLQRRSYFASGLVAKDQVIFKGANASVDSWNSNPDQDPSTAPVPYSAGVRTDRGSVASMAFTNSAVLVNEAHVWGYVATGGAQPQVGANGTIRGASTPEKVAIDSTRISTDFSAEFALVTAPVDGTPILTLGATLGVEDTSTKWRTPGIVLNGNQTLTILGDVTLILTAGPGTDAISVTGNAEIVVPKGSSLTVYTEGDVTVAGKGLGNSNVQPISCQIWGTNQTAGGQSIDIKGNGALTAVVYAPNGEVFINGNGNVMGSVVAHRITLVGNAAFHYDESLADQESNAPFGIAKWRELTSAADRAPYTARFEGW